MLTFYLTLTSGALSFTALVMVHVGTPDFQANRFIH